MKSYHYFLLIYFIRPVLLFTFRILNPVDYLSYLIYLYYSSYIYMQLYIQLLFTSYYMFIVQHNYQSVVFSCAVQIH